MITSKYFRYELLRLAWGLHVLVISVEHIVGRAVVLVRVEHLGVEYLEELYVFVLKNGRAPSVCQFEQRIMKLLLSESICVLGRFCFLFLLLNLFVFISVLLASATLSRLRVAIEVFANDFRKVICVDAWSQDLTNLHEDFTVLILAAEFGTASESKMLSDKVNDGLSDARVILELFSLVHVLLRVHRGVSIFVVGLRWEVVTRRLEDVSQIGVADLLGVIICTSIVCGHCLSHFLNTFFSKIITI